MNVRKLSIFLLIVASVLNLSSCSKERNHALVVSGISASEIEGGIQYEVLGEKRSILIRLKTERLIKSRKCGVSSGSASGSPIAYGELVSDSGAKMRWELAGDGVLSANGISIDPSRTRQGDSALVRFEIDW